MRVLVVDDDPITLKLVEAALSRHHWIVEPAATGEEALELAKVYDYDILVLDLRLPDGEGTETLRQLRSAQVDTPVLMLSAVKDQHAKVESLIAGADDYLVKPFDKDELRARVQAIVRRSKGHAASVIHVGRMTVDLDARKVSIDGKPLHVTGKEYSILELLSMRKGMTLTKETFLDHLYGGMDEPEHKIIDVFICKLRKKIAAITGDEPHIETVWGRGYMLKDPSAAHTGLAEPRREWGAKTTMPPIELSELDLLLLQLLPTPDAEDTD